MNCKFNLFINLRSSLWLATFHTRFKIYEASKIYGHYVLVMWPAIIIVLYVIIMRDFVRVRKLLIKMWNLMSWLCYFHVHNGSVVCCLLFFTGKLSCWGVHVAVRLLLLEGNKMLTSRRPRAIFYHCCMHRSNLIIHNNEIKIELDLKLL